MQFDYFILLTYLITFGLGMCFNTQYNKFKNPKSKIQPKNNINFNKEFSDISL